MDRMRVEQAKITVRAWANLTPDEHESGKVARAAWDVLAALEQLEQQREAARELADRWNAAADRMRARYEALGAVSSVAQELERCASELRAIGEE